MALSLVVTDTVVEFPRSPGRIVATLAQQSHYVVRPFFPPWKSAVVQFHSIERFHCASPTSHRRAMPAEIAATPNRDLRIRKVGADKKKLSGLFERRPKRVGGGTIIVVRGEHFILRSGLLHSLPPSSKSVLKRGQRGLFTRPTFLHTAISPSGPSWRSCSGRRSR